VLTQAQTAAAAVTAGGVGAQLVAFAKWAAIGAAVWFGLKAIKDFR